MAWTREVSAAYRLKGSVSGVQVGEREPVATGEHNAEANGVENTKGIRARGRDGNEKTEQGRTYASVVRRRSKMGFEHECIHVEVPSSLPWRSLFLELSAVELGRNRKGTMELIVRDWSEAGE